MTTFKFFKKEEIKEAKKQKRNPVPTFGITGTIKMIMFYVNKYELKENYVWLD